ncbi:MAG: hypothetical protein BMS9Abin22_512 [Gammaproteobacteria bacterium]|nr:MAG: hypothetical protein BMS9Abin22_512 [Gammaproteobacteria bacterium]
MTTMRAAKQYLLLALILVPLLCAPVTAATILKVEVNHSKGRYTVMFDARLDADSAIIRQHLTDYDNLTRLSDTITESRILQTYPDGKQRILVTVNSCVLFFCKTIKSVQDVETLDNGDIMARSDPEESDYSYATQRWQIIPENGHTRLKHQAELVPKFYVPPLIGTWLVKMRIRNELRITVQRLEILAGDAKEADEVDE